MPEPIPPPPVFTGSILSWRQSFSYQYDPNTGLLYNESGQGFFDADIIARYNQCVLNGIACDLTFSGGRWTLNLHDTSGQANVDTWQLQMNELALPVQRNPRHLTGGAYEILTDDLDKISSVINHGSVDEFNTQKAEFDAAGKTYASSLLVRMNRGETHYAKSGYVLRHTTNVAARSTWNVADVNVDRIYTTAQLITECSDGSLWVYPIPTRLRTKLTAIDSAMPSAPGNYRKGWLKKGSTESTAANYRVDITTEYWFDNWSTEEYFVV